MSTSMFKKALLLPLAFMSGLITFGTAVADDSTKSIQPTVVLVHDAFTDGSSWSKVIPLLQAKGVRVVAVQNNLDSLAGDVEETRRVIESQPGPVVLVGHAWGGTVITEAGSADQVVALVYVAAFAPDVGQSTAELGKTYPTPPGLAHLVTDRSGYLTLSEEGMRKNFAEDLRSSDVTMMLATQGSINSKALDEKVSTAAWKTKPTWYIISTDDRMINPLLERHLALEMRAWIAVLPTGHVPMQSRPVDVTRVILDAVKSVQPAKVAVR